MTSPSDQPARRGPIRVHLPGGLEPLYVNFALISNSASEIVIDLAQIMPQVPQARVRARAVMTPLNAKLFLRALGEHLARFEDQFGEIQIPEGTSLADQLFRSSSADDSPSGEDESDGT